MALFVLGKMNLEIQYYRGITETSKDELGEVIDTSIHQLTELKQDILKLLKE